MSLPDTLRDPRIRWDNITPAPFDVRMAGKVLVKDVTGAFRPAETYEERTGPRSEVWWLVPHGRWRRG